MAGSIGVAILIGVASAILKCRCDKFPVGAADSLGWVVGSCLGELWVSHSVGSGLLVVQIAASSRVCVNADTSHWRTVRTVVGKLLSVYGGISSEPNIGALATLVSRLAVGILIAQACAKRVHGVELVEHQGRTGNNWRETALEGVDCRDCRNEGAAKLGPRVVQHRESILVLAAIFGMQFCLRDHQRVHTGGNPLWLSEGLGVGTQNPTYECIGILLAQLSALGLEIGKIVQTDGGLMIRRSGGRTRGKAPTIATRPVVSECIRGSSGRARKQTANVLGGVQELRLLRRAASVVCVSAVRIFNTRARVR
jgi:hypothetical protein